MDDRIQQISNRAKDSLVESAKRAATMHAGFLEKRLAGMEQIGNLLEQQISEASGDLAITPGFPTSSPPGTYPLAASPVIRRAALFNKDQMNEFALGSMAKCFGPEFSIYENRRHPRIPNGDLMLMTRVLEINGQRLKFDQPSSIVVEYDVPADAWYFRDNAYPFIPYSVWMEIALQPCGYLTSWQGTALLHPEVDYYFRNLDGNSTLISNMDFRGKTITTRASLRSTISNDTTMIQKFEYALTCNEEPIFEGETIFGYFPPETMATQAGLDAGKRKPPLLEHVGEGKLKGTWLDLPALSAGSANKPHARLSTNQLNFLDAIYVDPATADRPYDYVYSHKKNGPSAWFYTCHFHHDPVMPGSLGVEAILQTIQAYALQQGLAARFQSPHFEMPVGQKISWKYRGQVLPTHSSMKIEASILAVKEDIEGTLIFANASLWADTMRIYEIKNAVVRLSEA